MQKKIIKVNVSDNVAVALVNLKVGEIVSFEGEEIHILSNTKSKHKIALEDFESGARIIMYGVLVGSANGAIKKGEVLTIENVNEGSQYEEYVYSTKVYNGIIAIEAHRATKLIDTLNTLKPVNFRPVWKKNNF